MCSSGCVGEVTVVVVVRGVTIFVAVVAGVDGVSPGVVVVVMVFAGLDGLVDVAGRAGILTVFVVGSAAASGESAVLDWARAGPTPKRTALVNASASAVLAGRDSFLLRRRRLAMPSPASAMTGNSDQRPPPFPTVVQPHPAASLY